MIAVPDPIGHNIQSIDGLEKNQVSFALIAGETLRKNVTRQRMNDDGKEDEQERERKCRQ